jgi:hypothetical protein
MNCNALRYYNNSYTEENHIQLIRCEVRIKFNMKGIFKKTIGDGILCSAWSIDEILV